MWPDKPLVRERHRTNLSPALYRPLALGAGVRGDRQQHYYMNGTNDENGGNGVNGWTYHARVNDRLRHLLRRRNYLADCKDKQN